MLTMYLPFTYLTVGESPADSAKLSNMLPEDYNYQLRNTLYYDLTITYPTHTTSTKTVTFTPYHYKGVKITNTYNQLANTVETITGGNQPLSNSALQIEQTGCPSCFSFRPIMPYEALLHIHPHCQAHTPI